MHKTTNKKRYETPCLIIAEVECVNLIADSPKVEDAPIIPAPGDDDNLVKGSTGMSLWDEGW